MLRVGDLGDVVFYETESFRLIGVLEAATTASTLPEPPISAPGLSGLLIRLRLGQRAARIYDSADLLTSP